MARADIEAAHVHGTAKKVRNLSSYSLKNVSADDM
jgi:hypothetical protein